MRFVVKALVTLGLLTVVGFGYTGPATAEAAAGPTSPLMIVASTGQNASLCAAADRAVSLGEFAAAKVLYDALKDDQAAKACRATGLLALAAAQEANPATRVQRLVLQDGLTTWLTALVAFTVGVVLAGVRRVHITPGIAWVTSLAALGLVVLWQWFEPTRHQPEWIRMVAFAGVLALVLGAGFLASSAARAKRPVSIATTGNTDAENLLATQIVTEIQALGSAASSGVFAMAGTDITSSGLTAALEQVTQPVAKAALAIWNAVQLGAADRIKVLAETPADRPMSATVSIFEGGRLVTTSYVDGAAFCLDAAHSTPGELATTGKDLASGIAATVLLWRLQTNRRSHKRRPSREQLRLYGATRPMGVALSAVAHRRLSDGDEAAAALLYSRALDLDAGNRAARFGYTSARLRSFPEPTEARGLIADLEQMLQDDTTISPLRWRILYNVAAAHSNLAVTEHGLDMTQALNHLAQLSSDHFPGPEKLIVAADKPLWENLQRRSAVAKLALGPPGRSIPPDPERLKELNATRRTVSRAHHALVACGLALAYARTPSTETTTRRRLAAQTVEQLRLGGETPTTRAALMEDPFMSLVANTRPYRTLRTEWTPSPTLYEGIDSFGALAAQVARVHPSARILMARLATLTGRAAARSTFGVDDRILDRWQGAAQWLDAGQPVAWINLYQAAGYQDAATVRRKPDDQVAAALSATAKLRGVIDLPTPAQRQQMAS